MSDHVTPCVVGCGRPADGYFLCHWCADELKRSLSDVGELLDELTVNEQRAARFGPAVRSVRATESPLPYEPGAAFTRDQLVSTLDTWSRDLAEYCGEACEATTPDGLAWWIAARTQTIRVHPAADEIHSSIMRVIARAWRTIDRPAGRIYVGPCGGADVDECGTDLYARADPNGTGRLDPRQSVVRCPACGAEWNAEQRRAWLLDTMRETLATATEIASAAGMLAGHQISRQTVHTWGRRGAITVYGSNPSRFRVGEVIDRAVSMATRSRTSGQ